MICYNYQMNVINLSDVRGSDIVGGKASWLGELIRHGVNVPAGFVLATDAKYPVDELAAQYILKEFDHLGVERVAVRSSAASEDGFKNSYAGQFDTFLDVPRADLIDKINLCYDSFSDMQSEIYEHANGGFSIIVQTMIDAEFSGVVFTANPVNNDKDQLVIEAVTGLGEKLVSGLVTPETIIVDKDSKNLKERFIGDSDVRLTDLQINQLVDTSLSIEQMAKIPVDIEWSIVNDILYILQARPITTMQQ